MEAQARSSIPLPPHRRPGRLATGVRLSDHARRLPQPGVQGLGLLLVGVRGPVVPRPGTSGSDQSPRSAAVAAVTGPKKKRRPPRNGRPLSRADSVYRTTPPRPSSSGWSTQSEGSLPRRTAYRNRGSSARSPAGWQAGAHDRWMPIPTSMPTFSLNDDHLDDIEHAPAQASSPAPSPSPPSAPAAVSGHPRKKNAPAPDPDDLEALLADREDPEGSLLEDVSAVMGNFFPTSDAEPDNVLALRAAVMSGDTALVQTTVAEGGGPGLLLQGRPMPLQLAASRGDVSMARALCALGGRAAVEARSLTGQTPLHTAASAGHAEVCAALIETHPRCVDLLATTDREGSVGSSALHLACRLGCTDAADVLLAKGANPRRADDTIGTTLHYAARGLGPGRYFGVTKPALKLIASLIVHGAEVNDARGIPPPETEDSVVAAKAARQADLLERPVFSDHGSATGRSESQSTQSESEGETKRGWTPLHHAVHCSQWRIVVYLVYAGANPMAKDDNGITPLRLQPVPISEQDRLECEQKLRIGDVAAGNEDVDNGGRVTDQEDEEDDDAEADAAAEAERRGLYGEDAAWMGVNSASAAVRLGTQLRRLKEDEENLPPPLDITEEERYNGFAATYERLFGTYFKLGEEGPEARARAAARAARPRRTPLSPRVTPGRKFALVIANGRYTKAGVVPGVSVDADGVAKALAANGWTVQQIYDAPKATLLAALGAFVGNITGQQGHRSANGASPISGGGLLGPPRPSWAMSNSSFSATGARLGGIGRAGMRSAASFAPMSRGGMRTPGSAGVRPQTAPNWTASLMLPSVDHFGGGVPPPQSSPADILVWYGGAAASVQGRNVLLPNDVAVSEALLSHSARRVLSSSIPVSDLTQTLVDAAAGGGVAVLADCYQHPRLVRTGGGRSESSAVSEVVLPKQAGTDKYSPAATSAPGSASDLVSSSGAVVVLSRHAQARHAGRHGLKGTGERVWSKTAAGGLDAVGSAFSGTLLRMLQISQTTLAELVDKLPEAVWAQSETKQVTFVLDGLGDDARRMYVTEE